MAAVYADKGHHVIGYDINTKNVDAINGGKAPVIETDLQTYISKNADRLHASTNIRDVILNTSISFLIVPTPSEPDGSFSTRFVIDACKQIGDVLKEKKDYHLIVLSSTLLPGDCDGNIIPVLEEFSGKKCGEDFGFCYSPLFIAIGSVIHNLLFPDFFLIGQQDTRSGDILEMFYHTISENQTPVKRMSIPSAELTKISVNSFITMKITFANVLGEIAEHIPGINVDDVTQAIGADHRIGKAYLTSGLGFGGPCFPRDNRAFGTMANRRGVEVPFAEKTDKYNQTIAEHTADKIISITSSPEDIIAIIGLSYKPQTAFCEESQGITIANELSKKNFRLHAYNEDGNEDAHSRLGENVLFFDDLAQCTQDAKIILLTLPVKDLDLYSSVLKDRPLITVVDPWRQLSKHHANGLLGTTNYFPLGKYR